jgi:hypothetical protein
MRSTIYYDSNNGPIPTAWSCPQSRSDVFSIKSYVSVVTCWHNLHIPSKVKIFMPFLMHVLTSSFLLSDVSMCATRSVYHICDDVNDPLFCRTFLKSGTEALRRDLDLRCRVRLSRSASPMLICPRFAICHTMPRYEIVEFYMWVTTAVT